MDFRASTLHSCVAWEGQSRGHEMRLHPTYIAITLNVYHLAVVLALVLIILTDAPTHTLHAA